jgi:2-keto-4-pentenoate hydratase
MEWVGNVLSWYHSDEGRPQRQIAEIAFVMAVELKGGDCTIEAIVMLLQHLGERNESLPAGSLVLTGGTMAAIGGRRGDTVTARFEGIGSMSFEFE